MDTQNPQLLLVVQSPFENCYSPFSLTTFFYIGVYRKAILPFYEANCIVNKLLVWRVDALNKNGVRMHLKVLEIPWIFISLKIAVSAGKTLNFNPNFNSLSRILFLIMINDLAIHSPLRSSHWKYVDDVTISEVTSLGEASSLQNDINCISQWAQ